MYLMFIDNTKHSEVYNHVFFKDKAMQSSSIPYDLRHLTLQLGTDQ